MLKNTEYYKAIVETKNISKAAEMLYISQPALSIYLSNLEKALGAKLFDRSKTPLEITYAGMIYYDYVIRYENLATQLKRDFEVFAGEANGRLRIGISHWISLYFASRVLPVFAKKYPYVENELIQHGVHQLEQEMRSKKLDICIMHTSFPGPGIVYDSLTNERILLFCPADSQLAKDHPTSFARPSHMDIHLLADKPILCNEPEQVLHRTVCNMFSKYSIEPYFRITATSTFTLVELTAAGMGYSFVPELGEYFQRDLDRLAVYTVDDPILSWPVHIAHCRNVELSALAQDFISITKTILRHEKDPFGLYGQKP